MIESYLFNCKQIVCVCLYVDKQKENDCLRETLSRRTAKLELSRKECETLREERTHLQNSLYR